MHTDFVKMSNYLLFSLKNEMLLNPLIWRVDLVVQKPHVSVCLSENSQKAWKMQ